MKSVPKTLAGAASCRQGYLPGSELRGGTLLATFVRCDDLPLALRSGEVRSETNDKLAEQILEFP